MYEDRNIGWLIEKQKISGLRNSPFLHLLVKLTARHSVTVVQHVTSGSQSITSRQTEYHRRVTEVFFRNIFIFTKIYKSGSSHPFYYWWGLYLYSFTITYMSHWRNRNVYCLGNLWAEYMTHMVNVRAGGSHSHLLA